MKRANLRGHAADLDTTHTLFITDIDRASLGVRSLVLVGRTRGKCRFFQLDRVQEGDR